LVNSKKLFPEYKELPSHALQDVIKRVEKAFDRWIKGDKKGKRSGRPRFKGQGRYKSIAFPDPVKPEHIDANLIQLPKIGVVKVILHRPIPDGFKVKTAEIVKKADGYYLTLSLEDASVPVLSPELPTMENTIGIDMGLKSFLVDDSGEEIPIPQHYRKAERRLKKLQRSLSRKKKGSKRRQKAVKRVAKAHLKVSNQRKDFHYKAAKKLLSKGKNIGHEDLNIKGIARTRMAKSTHDAGWGQFLQILSVKAANAGLMTIAVNPNGTTQNCSNCGKKVQKTIQDRWHSCHHCGCSLDRDHNAAINVKHRAVGHLVLKAQETPDGIPGVTEKPALYRVSG
jgi:putative transposase